MDTPSPSLSLSTSPEISELVPAKSRNRKTAKRQTPHSLTLHHLWEKSKSTEEAHEDGRKQTSMGAYDSIEVAQPLVFKVDPKKLMAIVNSTGPADTIITPPTSFPEAVSETLVNLEEENHAEPKTPRSTGKKQKVPQSPSEEVRRSPRNLRPANEPVPEALPTLVVEEKKTHPFFLGKEALQSLRATAQASVPVTASSELVEPPKKRRKCSSSDRPPPTREDSGLLLPPKPIQLQPPRSLHPFFMSRTSSMESTASTQSLILPPLFSAKPAYLGNAKIAPFPSHEMNHVYDEKLQPPLKRHGLLLKPKKGKAVCYDSGGDSAAYLTLADYRTSIDFIPPEKLIIPKSEVDKMARSMLTPQSHHALLRAYHILCTEAGGRDPDSQAWTYKFRPRRPDELLNPGDPGVALRDWMTGKRKTLSSAMSKEMDDFIVDDEMLSSDERATDDDDESPRKPLRRRKEKFISYSNIVILYGPHGVGKSAAVEAVAEELGYQVFEISPGSRRGAKELMEAVGEVGQSELVTKHKDVVSAPSVIPGESKVHGRKGLICLDEVDVLYEEDKGFWSCVALLVEKSRQPIIMTCNDLSVIPENFANCKMIEFIPATDQVLLQDYLSLIALSQGHILDSSQLYSLYLDAQRDLRKTIAQLQFWCQFGVGDSRSGAEWINWNGNESDCVMSRGTYIHGIEWRQHAAAGDHVVLETVESGAQDIDLEHMIFPKRIDDELATSQSMFKRGQSVYTAITEIEEFLDTLSVLDCTCDQQFTVYEVMPRVNPSSDDVLFEPILRDHPGRRFEQPQGVEIRWSASIRILVCKVLRNKLKEEGYVVPPLTTEEIYTQPTIDFVRSRRSTREEICEPLDQLVYCSVQDDKYAASLGTLHSLDTIIVDVLPQIRQILRSERTEKLMKESPVSLGSRWSNKRITRGKIKDEKEGKKCYFDNRVDTDSVLSTWLDTSGNEKMH